jgi:hypothetical protein
MHHRKNTPAFESRLAVGLLTIRNPSQNKTTLSFRPNSWKSTWEVALLGIGNSRREKALRGQAFTTLTNVCFKVEPET